MNISHVNQILLEHLNNQGFKQSHRHMTSSMHSDLNSKDEQERVAHIMKIFRIFCLIIHKQTPGSPVLTKDSLLLNNCLQAIARVTNNERAMSPIDFSLMNIPVDFLVQRRSEYSCSRLLCVCGIDNDIAK
jgi:hypothetical protein